MAMDDRPIDADGPSEEALELLSRLHERQFDRGWRGTTGPDVQIADVQAVFLRMPSPPGRDKELPNRFLSEYLSELADAGHLTLSSRTDGERRIPLPRSIRLKPVRSAVRAIPPMPPLEREMAWVEEYWALPRTKDRIRAAYEALNGWLHRGYKGMRIPTCERALQIFGHHPFFHQPELPGEKVCSTLVAKPLFFDRQWLLEMINAFDVDPPLLSKDFSTAKLAEDSGGYHRLGKGRGRGLLVIENSTTYWSISHMLRHIDHRIGHVAWGSGVTFQRSIGSITSNDDVSDVVYFGDLDPSGLSFPIRADRYVPGLEVRPAVQLYDALLRLGTPGRCPPKERR
jgi:hypothetical protein